MRDFLYLSLRRVWWGWKGYPAHRISRLLEESQWWPKPRLETFRDRKLTALIAHCYQHVPYYRRVMNERNLRPRDIQSAGDLCKLPVLTKEIVRANWQDLRAQNISDKYTSLVATGGTTGEPMRIAKDTTNGAWASMSFERGVSWGGLKPGMTFISLKGGSIGGTEKTWRQKLSGRIAGRVHLRAYDLTPDNVHRYATAVRREGAKFIVGYASNIYMFSRWLLERKESLELEAAFTTSERLYPRWANTIRQALNCRIYSYYGCGECNSLGYQCQEGEAYHVPEEHVLLELQLDSGETAMSGSGQVLLTDMDNYAMPLLRYRNGDYLTLDRQPCGCGRSLGLISKLEGRFYDFLLNKKGQLVSGGICDFIIGDVEGVAESQVVQESLDHIRVLIVASKTLADEKKDYIRRSFRHYLGQEVRIEIELVHSIPRTNAEKLRISVNKMLENPEWNAVTL